MYFFFHLMLENHTKILCKTSCIGKGLLTLWRQIRFHLKLRGAYCSIMFQPRVPGHKTQHSVPKAVIWNIVLLVYIHLHISRCIDARWCNYTNKEKTVSFHFVAYYSFLWVITSLNRLLEISASRELTFYVLQNCFYLFKNAKTIWFFLII